MKAEDTKKVSYRHQLSWKGAAVTLPSQSREGSVAELPPRTRCGAACQEVRVRMVRGCFSSSG